MKSISSLQLEFSKSAPEDVSLAASLYQFKQRETVNKCVPKSDSCTSLESTTSSCSCVLTSNQNWQLSKRNVSERNAAMLLNELMSDIVFVVGTTECQQLRIPAHKYVLATSSSVFYAMFYGPLADNQKEITIPDVEPSAFVDMLRYLYCDHIKIDSESVLEILYCAKKYMLPHLVKMCILYLESNLTAQNACFLLSQSILYDETSLMQSCLEIIDVQTELVLLSDAFTNADCKTVARILARETLNSSEIIILKSVLRWASTECQRRKLQVTSENQRTVLGDILYQIRIPSMTLEDFANEPAQLNILTPKEINEIFLYYTASIKPKMRFPTNARMGLTLQKCQRFLSTAHQSNQWRYRGRCDSIQFSVNKRIYIFGYSLYGSSNGAAKYKVKIILQKLESVLAVKDSHFYSDGSRKTFPIFFDHPIQVEANAFYIASAILDGLELGYFGQDGQNEITINSHVTFQFQCSSESTNGTGVKGGQIPEIIFYSSLK